MTNGCRPAEHDKGSALVLAVFVLALLTGTGVAVLFLGQHEARMSKSGLRAKQAFYLAESGVEDARLTLFASNTNGSFEDELLVAAGADGELDFDVNALVPTFDDQGLLTGLTGYDDDVPLRSLTGLNSFDSRGGYIAFLTNDPINGRLNLTDDNQRVMITAVGAGEGSSLEIVEVIIEPLQILPPIPPAAITLLGPLPAFFDNGNSNAQEHDGNDCGVAGGPYAPIVGTVSPESKAQVQDDMNRPDNFSSGPLPFTGTDTVADLTDLTDPIVDAAGHGIIDPTWTSCADIKTIVTKLKQNASYYCNTDSQACSFPTTGPSTVVFIDGDLTSTPSGTFSGTLVVTGELTYNGNTGWNGIIMAVGEGRVIRSGGGDGTPRGGLIVAAIDPTPDGPAADWSDWCTSGPGGYGVSYYDTSGGGSSAVQWCTDYLNAANPPRTYEVVDFLQR